MKLFWKLPIKTKVNLIIQSVAMLMGTSTHVLWAFKNGFLSKEYNAPITNILFWDSLTFLDPLAAILLFLKPKIGVLLTFIIIVADVVHNNLYYSQELYFQEIGLSTWISRYWMIIGQAVFAVFVVLSLKSNLNAITNVIHGNNR